MGFISAFKGLMGGIIVPYISLGEGLVAMFLQLNKTATLS